MTEHAADYSDARVLRRLAAMVYDSLLLMAISMGYYAIAVALNVLVQGQPSEGQAIEWGNASWLVFTGWLITLVSFYCFFWKKFGQTLGMRAWRMRLVSTRGSLTTGQCLLRCLLACISLLCFGLGYFWLWLDPQHRTFHDRLSHTRVLVLPKDKN